MSNRRRRSNAGHRRRPPGPALAGLLATDALDDLIDQLQTCGAGACLWPASRWYVRQDLTDARIVVVPVCWDHYGQADALVCPDGHGEAGCLSSPDDQHFADQPVDVVNLVGTALLSRLGVGIPQREDWRRLDVVRPTGALR